MASASARIASAIASPSSDEVADRLVAGHQPVDRPAQVDGRRARADERVRGAPRASPGAHTGCVVADLVGGQCQPDGRDLADRRRAADDHVADRSTRPRRRSGARPRRARRAAGAGRSCRGRRRPRGTGSGSRSARLGVGGRRARDAGSHGRRRHSGRGCALAASAEARWSACAAPTTVAALWTSSPANWRKKRRRPRSTPGRRAPRSVLRGSAGRAPRRRRRSPRGRLRRRRGSPGRRRARSWGPSMRLPRPSWLST